ncbi:MAG TPA: chemotaxis response regulator protein-glutamate methylesterase [Geobacteraceae bacterium]
MNTTRSQGKIRVLVVDDSAFIRRAIIRMFEQSPDIQVIDVAADGEMAIDLIKKLRPDVVTLDVQMPVLDGLSALERIMKECPTPVVMLSCLTGKGGDKTLKALELGAVDFIDKTACGGPMDISALARELTAKILVAARVDMLKLASEKARGPVVASVAPLTTAIDTEVVVIGTSTGGPPALQAVLGKIPANFPCPILIVQHMPEGFTASLAERLNRLSPLAVKEATDGERVLPGGAYLAPAGRHLKLWRSADELHVRLDQAPETALHRPSVDALLESAAAVCGKRSLAVVLTGMGKDGSVGAQALKRAGGRVVVEAEETAIVFGMPKAVMAAVQVDATVPLHQVADTIIRMV